MRSRNASSERRTIRCTRVGESGRYENGRSNAPTGCSVPFVLKRSFQCASETDSGAHWVGSRCFAAAILLVDYRKTVRLRNQIETLAVGTAELDVIRSLGQPDAIWNGSRPDEATGNMVGGYAMWIYCSRFDWNWQRSRWNDAPFVPYWVSRLDPSVDKDHDAVV